ncbi:MAG: hypothetical protein EZS28_012778, partial [Streblomastix strix]
MDSFVLQHQTQLTSLDQIDLRMNMIKEIPRKTFTYLRNLRTLFMTHNELFSLPSDLNQLIPRLRDLWVGENNLTTLPNSIGSNDDLQTLYASCNSLRECPPLVARSASLRVNLSQNILLKAPLIGPDVETFSAERNMITYMPDIARSYSQNQNTSSSSSASNTFALAQAQASSSFGDVGIPPRLNMISLRFNHMHRIPPAIMTAHLAVLLMSGNQIKDINASISKQLTLRTIDLSFNLIKFIPDCFSQLYNLQKLYLAFNKIQTVPPWVFALPSLKHLNLAGNQIEYLPTEEDAAKSVIDAQQKLSGKESDQILKSDRQQQQQSGRSNRQQNQYDNQQQNNEKYSKGRSGALSPSQQTRGSSNRDKNNRDDDQYYNNQQQSYDEGRQSPSQQQTIQQQQQSQAQSYSSQVQWPTIAIPMSAAAGSSTLTPANDTIITNTTSPQLLSSLNQVTSHQDKQSISPNPTNQIVQRDSKGRRIISNQVGIDADIESEDEKIDGDVKKAGADGQVTSTQKQQHLHGASSLFPGQQQQDNKYQQQQQYNSGLIKPSNLNKQSQLQSSNNQPSPVLTPTGKNDEPAQPNCLNPSPLVRIQLESNRLRNFPALLLKYQTLTSIDVSHNRIISLPNDLFLKLPGLQRMDVSFNRITNVSNLEFPVLGEVHHNQHASFTQNQFRDDLTDTRKAADFINPHSYSNQNSAASGSFTYEGVFFDISHNRIKQLPPRFLSLENQLQYQLNQQQAQNIQQQSPDAFLPLSHSTGNLASMQHTPNISINPSSLNQTDTDQDVNNNTNYNKDQTKTNQFVPEKSESPPILKAASELKRYPSPQSYPMSKQDMKNEMNANQSSSNFLSFIDVSFNMIGALKWGKEMDFYLKPYLAQLTSINPQSSSGERNDQQQQQQSSKLSITDQQQQSKLFNFDQSQTRLTGVETLPRGSPRSGTYSPIYGQQPSNSIMAPQQQQQQQQPIVLSSTQQSNMSFLTLRGKSQMELSNASPQSISATHSFSSPHQGHGFGFSALGQSSPALATSQQLSQPRFAPSVSSQLYPILFNLSNESSTYRNLLFLNYASGCTPLIRCTSSTLSGSTNKPWWVHIRGLNQFESELERRKEVLVKLAKFKLQPQNRAQENQGSTPTSPRTHQVSRSNQGYNSSNPKSLSGSSHSPSNSDQVNDRPQRSNIRDKEQQKEKERERERDKFSKFYLSYFGKDQEELRMEESGTVSPRPLTPIPQDNKENINDKDNNQQQQQIYSTPTKNARSQLLQQDRNELSDLDEILLRDVVMKQKRQNPNDEIFKQYPNLSQLIGGNQGISRNPSRMLQKKQREEEKKKQEMSSKLGENSNDLKSFVFSLNSTLGMSDFTDITDSEKFTKNLENLRQASSCEQCFSKSWVEIEIQEREQSDREYRIKEERDKKQQQEREQRKEKERLQLQLQLQQQSSSFDKEPITPSQSRKEEQKRKEEDRKRRYEEEKRKKEEEELKRKEEERKRKEEEKKIKEEQKLDSERRRREDDEKRREQKRIEEDRRREEQRKKKEEEEKKKEEQRRKDEERRHEREIQRQKDRTGKDRDKYNKDGDRYKESDGYRDRYKDKDKDKDSNQAQAEQQKQIRSGSLSDLKKKDSNETEKQKQSKLNPNFLSLSMSKSDSQTAFNYQQLLSNTDRLLVLNSISDEADLADEDETPKANKQNDQNRAFIEQLQQKKEESPPPPIIPIPLPHYRQNSDDIEISKIIIIDKKDKDNTDRNINDHPAVSAVPAQAMGLSPASAAALAVAMQLEAEEQAAQEEEKRERIEKQQREEMKALSEMTMQLLQEEKKPKYSDRKPKRDYFDDSRTLQDEEDRRRQKEEDDRRRREEEDRIKQEQEERRKNLEDEKKRRDEEERRRREADEKRKKDRENRERDARDKELREIREKEKQQDKQQDKDNIDDNNNDNALNRSKERVKDNRDRDRNRDAYKDREQRDQNEPRDSQRDKYRYQDKDKDKQYQLQRHATTSQMKVTEKERIDEKDKQYELRDTDSGKEIVRQRIKDKDQNKDKDDDDELVVGSFQTQQDKNDNQQIRDSERRSINSQNSARRREILLKRNELKSYAGQTQVASSSQSSRVKGVYRKDEVRDLDRTGDRMIRSERDSQRDSKYRIDARERDKDKDRSDLNISINKDRDADKDKEQDTSFNRISDRNVDRDKIGSRDNQKSIEKDQNEQLPDDADNQKDQTQHERSRSGQNQIMSKSTLYLKTNQPTPSEVHQSRRLSSNIQQITKSNSYTSLSAVSNQPSSNSNPLNSPSQSTKLKTSTLDNSNSVYTPTQFASTILNPSANQSATTHISVRDLDRSDTRSNRERYFDRENRDKDKDKDYNKDKDQISDRARDTENLNDRYKYKEREDQISRDHQREKEKLSLSQSTSNLGTHQNLGHQTSVQFSRPVPTKPNLIGSKSIQNINKDQIRNADDSKPTAQQPGQSTPSTTTSSQSDRRNNTRSPTSQLREPSHPSSSNVLNSLSGTLKRGSQANLDDQSSVASKKSTNPETQSQISQSQSSNDTSSQSQQQSSQASSQQSQSSKIPPLSLSPQIFNTPHQEQQQHGYMSPLSPGESGSKRPHQRSTSLLNQPSPAQRTLAQPQPSIPGATHQQLLPSTSSSSAQQQTGFPQLQMSPTSQNSHSPKGKRVLEQQRSLSTEKKTTQNFDKVEFTHPINLAQPNATQPTFSAQGRIIKHHRALSTASTDSHNSKRSSETNTPTFDLNGNKNLNPNIKMDLNLNINTANIPQFNENSRQKNRQHHHTLSQPHSQENSDVVKNVFDVAFDNYRSEKQEPIPEVQEPKPTQSPIIQQQPQQQSRPIRAVDVISRASR